MNTSITSKKRLIILLYAFFFAMIVMAGALIYNMFIRGEWLQTRVESQWMTQSVVEAERGRILDTNGNVLAQSSAAETVLLRPNEIDDPGMVANLLAPILDMDYQDIFEAASDKSRSEIWIARKVDKEVADEIHALELDGVGFYIEMQRYYPNSDFASQLIGYTNIDGDGQDGIEKEYDKYLSGVDGSVLQMKDGLGNSIAGTQQVYVEPESGYDIVMNLDERIQSYAESAAREALVANEAKSISCVVMEPDTGAVLAMVNYPEIDPNDPDRSDVDSLLELSRNSVIADAYEPGSTFKIITTAAAIDSGATDEHTHYNCPGYRVVGESRIKCWRSDDPHGDQTLHEAVANSCNPAFMDMALEMGTDTFYDYIYEFGFGSNTGVDFSTDGAGIVRDAKYVTDADLARIGFGQSIAVTPLQLTSAICATINGGYLYTPQIVSEIRTPEGETVEIFDNEPVTQVISEQTSALMRDILLNVVDNGSGANAQIEGYSVGGKTGTAQVYAEDGTIAEGKNISSFVGFAPAEDPQFLVLFIVNEPGVPVTFGSVVAAPYVKTILEKSLKSASVPTTRETTGSIEVPDLTGMTWEEANTKTSELGLSFSLQGEGEVLTQVPSPGVLVEEGSTVFGYTTGSEIEDTMMTTIPDLTDKTLAEASAMLNTCEMLLKVKDEYGGSGVIKSQSPEAGTPITRGADVIVTCYSDEEYDAILEEQEQDSDDE